MSGDARQAAAVKLARTVFQRPGWSIRVDARLAVTSTPTTYEIGWSVRAEHNGAVIHDHADQAVISRGPV